MLIALFAGIQMLFGGGFSLFGDDISLVKEAVENTVEHEDHRKSLLTMLEGLAKEGKALDKEMKLVSKEMKEIHLSYDSKVSDYVRTASKADLAFGQFFESSLKLRKSMKEKTSKQDWDKIFNSINQ